MIPWTEDKDVGESGFVEKVNQKSDYIHKSR
jgi:hypothetical protein